MKNKFIFGLFIIIILGSIFLYFHNLSSISSLKKYPLKSSSVTENVVSFYYKSKSSSKVLRTSVISSNSLISHSQSVSQKSNQRLNLKNTQEAASYLRKVLGYNSQDYIVDGDDRNNTTDEKGKYYTVQIIYLPWRLQNKTGTLGIYKVYTNGEYIKIN